MKRIRRLFFMLVASGLVAVHLGAMNVHAQEGSGLQIQPPRQELSIERGQAQSFNVSLKNIADHPIVAKYYVHDFKSDGVSGDPVIVIDPNIRSDSSILEFLTDLEDIPLAPGETKNFRLTAQIPETTPPGAYYGLVRYEATPVNEANQPTASQFSLNSSLGVLVLIEVPGDAAKGAEISQITPQRVRLDKDNNPEGEPKSGSFFTSTPNQIAIEIRNTGQTFVKPFGRVVVRNWGTEVANYELNADDAISPRGNILPDSTRTFTDRVDFKGIGRFTVEASMSYEQGGEAVTRVKTFWVIPAWLIALMVVLVLAILFGGYKLSRHLGKQKHSV